MPFFYICISIDANYKNVYWKKLKYIFGVIFTQVVHERVQENINLAMNTHERNNPNGCEAIMERNKLCCGEAFQNHVACQG